jgi:hypothetical protein
MSDIEIRRKREEAFEWVEKIAESKVEHQKKELSEPFLKVDFRCGRTKKDWAILLKKDSESSFFDIVRIVTANASSPTKSGYPSTSTSATVDLGRIKNHGTIRCPYCSNGGWVKCGCGKLSCEGGVTERDGREWHVCPWCDEEGFIEGTFQTIDGEIEDKKRISGPKEKPSLPRSYKALPP